MPWSSGTGPLNFGGLRPKCLVPFTEFKASGADMYGTLDPPNLALLGPCLIPRSPKIGGLTYPLGKIFETSRKEAFELRHFDLRKVIFRFGPLLCLKRAIGYIPKFTENRPFCGRYHTKNQKMALW
jgi:hypothetical protein